MNAQELKARHDRMETWMRNPGNVGRLIIVKSGYDRHWTVTGVHVFPRKYKRWEDAVGYATKRLAYLHGFYPMHPTSGDAA